jgi:hypothetical protein
LSVREMLAKTLIESACYYGRVFGGKSLCAFRI